MIQEAVQRVHNGELGRLVAHYSTYYTNPVKPMPPESERPAGMSDIEWQIRNWYNFTWLCGDSLVEQAVHNADKIMWVMKDQPPLSCVAVGGRAVPANGGNIYDHFEVELPVPERLSGVPRQPSVDRLLQRHARLRHGHRGHAGARRRASRASRRPTARSSGSSRARPTTCISASTTCCSRRSASGKPKNDDLNLATSTLLAIMGRNAAYSGQQLTWDQALNSQVSLVPKPVDVERRSTRCPAWRFRAGRKVV